MSELGSQAVLDRPAPDRSALGRFYCKSWLQWIWPLGLLLSRALKRWP